MKILVVNCGSSSIKYKLYEFPSKSQLSKGIIERIGEEGSKVRNHNQGIKVVINQLLGNKIIKGLEEISVVGHRVVHGGEHFREPTVINGKVIEKIKVNSDLAPLHNPANLAGIMGCKEILPETKQVAVFDTAFYQSIAQHVYMYAIPGQYYKKYGVRKYGFHGTSHQFVAGRAAELLAKPLSEVKLITCHLGNGCSITAIDKGKATDTSMGFTPLEGLMMGTRSGDIDVAAVFHIMKKEKLTVEQMGRILNRESGILGVSGVSNDIRVVKERAAGGDKLSRLALEMFIYRIKKYIGAYFMVLGGADAVCFTAGIGENNEDIVGRLKEDIYKIASPDTKVFVIPTDEELMIAGLTYELAREGSDRK
ncbi:MAG: acetate kinase [Candidatus Omnitrophota bacterium]|nr:MAG: acetate kinase [Candidatus Omnitrophota bacterium]